MKKQIEITYGQMRKAMPPILAAINQTKVTQGLTNEQIVTCCLYLCGSIIQQLGIGIDVTGSVEDELRPLVTGYNTTTTHDSE